MTDDLLPRAFDALHLEAPRFSAMEERVLAAYDVTQRPLALEWVEMTREHPFVSGVSLAAAAAVLLLATPVGTVLFVLSLLA